MPIAEEVQLGRAKNELLRFFEKRLYIPKVYFNAEWSGKRVDLLAIDRDGVGDVHTAFLFSESYLGGEVNRVEKAHKEYEILETCRGISAQYKWICRLRTVQQPGDENWRWPDSFLEATFAADGIGRLGVVLVDLSAEKEDRVRVELRPERFRAFVGKLADEYVAQHMADWEIRP